MTSKSRYSFRELRRNPNGTRSWIAYRIESPGTEPKVVCFVRGNAGRWILPSYERFGEFKTRLAAAMGFEREVMS